MLPTVDTEGPSVVADRVKQLDLSWRRFRTSSRVEGWGVAQAHAPHLLGPLQPSLCATPPATKHRLFV